MNSKLKELLDQFITLYEGVLPDEYRQEHKFSIRTFFCLYVSYLASADARITWDECEVIEYYCGLSFSPEELARITINIGLDDDGFAREVPPALKFIVEVDNALTETGNSMERTMTSFFLEIVQYLADDLLFADGELSESEKERYLNYLNLLASYISENLILED